MHVHATEYTVGDRGSSAMPGDLPATSAYTFAIELRAEEAHAAGASRVEFDKPILAYVDNFLRFPAGTRVPAGSFMPDADQWSAADGGVVVDVLGVTNGRADLDTDGDGKADPASVLAARGIGDDERAALARVSAAPRSLWRVPLAHFSAWD